jgi:alanine racemase
MINAELTINLANIKHNYLYAKSLTSEKVFAVVKTNAYGLGARQITDFMGDSVNGFADGFAVATLDEALKLTTKKDILIMMGCFDKRELSVAIQNDFIIAITTKEQADNLLDLTTETKTKIFLKFDSGMNRLGLNEEQFISYYNKLKDNKNIEITMMSHFCCAENEDISKNQVKKLLEVKNKLKISKTSFTNSAGILNKLVESNISRLCVSRLGISLYGVNPTEKTHNLKPAVSLFAKIIAIKDIKQGDFIGYSQTFKCEKDTKIAIIKLGYGDGYPRNIKANTPVFVGNQRSVILGRVAMDMITIDVCEIPVKIGDKVELFGENISVEEVAKSADTIAYEIFCNMASRVERIYVK